MPKKSAPTLDALLRNSSIDDHEEILDAANAAIKADANDLVAHHTKAVALLKLDRYDDTIRFISAGDSKVQATCVFEKAYALYKVGNLEEATALLKTAGVESRRFSHLAGQVAYRAERSEEAIDIYKTLIREEAASEGDDLHINNAAVKVQMEWAGSASVVADNLPQSFEQCYNLACIKVAKGELKQATTLLHRATLLCKASDDLNDSDKEAELKPIWVQQAYIYAIEGKVIEAQELYAQLGSFSEMEPDVALVAQNNLMLLEAQQLNPYLTQRRNESVLSMKQQAKLFTHQIDLLTQNTLIADLDAYKVEGVQTTTHKTLLSSQPSVNSHISTVSVINSAAATQKSAENSSINTLQDLVVKRPHDIGLVLTIVQLQLRRGRVGGAIAALESLFGRLEALGTENAWDARFSPGLLAVFVTLLRKHGRLNAAKSVFAKAAKYWTEREGNAFFPSDSILVGAGIELMKSSNPDELHLAGSAFKKVCVGDSGSQIASAGLVASLAVFNENETTQQDSELPDTASLISGTEIEVLLRNGIPLLPENTSTRKRAAPDNNQKSTTKRRRRHLPKDFVEGSIPDPERWLPLRDRSSYRPKNKKSKKKAMDSTQGGVVKDEETLELVGGGGVKVEKASGGAASAKKKKKGKK